jgi:hypothetical protein
MSPDSHGALAPCPPPARAASPVAAVPRSVYDTWLIAQKLSPDQYIEATITLYLDIVNLFLELLRILQYLNNSGSD